MIQWEVVNYVNQYAKAGKADQGFSIACKDGFVPDATNSQQTYEMDMQLACLLVPAG